MALGADTLRTSADVTVKTRRRGQSDRMVVTGFSYNEREIDWTSLKSITCNNFMIPSKPDSGSKRSLMFHIGPTMELSVTIQGTVQPPIIRRTVW